MASDTPTQPEQVSGDQPTPSVPAYRAGHELLPLFAALVVSCGLSALRMRLVMGQPGCAPLVAMIALFAVVYMAGVYAYARRLTGATPTPCALPALWLLWALLALATLAVLFVWVDGLGMVEELLMLQARVSALQGGVLELGGEASEGPTSLGALVAATWCTAGQGLALGAFFAVLLLRAVAGRLPQPQAPVAEEETDEP